MSFLWHSWKPSSTHKITLATFLVRLLIPWSDAPASSPQTLLPWHPCGCGTCRLQKLKDKWEKRQGKMIDWKITAHLAMWIDYASAWFHELTAQTQLWCSQVTWPSLCNQAWHLTYSRASDSILLFAWRDWTASWAQYRHLPGAWKQSGHSLLDWMWPWSCLCMYVYSVVIENVSI